MKDTKYANQTFQMSPEGQREKENQEMMIAKMLTMGMSPDDLKKLYD